MKQLAAFFLMFIGCIVMVAAAEPATVTPAQADTWLAATPTAQVVDVRTKEEFEMNDTSMPAAPRETMAG